MNTRVPPTSSTIAVTEWVSSYLTRKLGDDKANAVRLAKAIGCERKAIYAYKNGERSPKLEVLAKILAYYGETEIRIPLKANFICCSHCQYFRTLNRVRMTGFCTKHGKGTLGENYCEKGKEKQNDSF